MTARDVANLKLGVSGSDPHIFRGGCGDPGDVVCDPGTTRRVRQQLYGVVPLQHQCGANIFELDGDPMTWAGIANPFGFMAGQSVPMKFEHAV